MRIVILFFFVLCFFKVDAIEGLNIHLLDSAKKYCEGKYRNYEKTSVLVNQLISQGLKVKNDSILAEAYYFKALNYYYEANNYCFNEYGTFVQDWGDECEKCHPELFAKHSACRDSVVFYLPYKYSKYLKLQEKNSKFYQDVDYDIGEMEKIKTRANLKKSNKQNELFSYSLVFALIIIGLVIFILVINRKKNKKIKFLLNNIEHKNNEIIDSINYAKRIQSAILPDFSDINKHIANVFVIYKPKDIVSGDFYYFNNINNDNFIAVADCTGHGVPGAFMSLVGSKELKIANSQSSSPSEILKLLNNGIKATLKQNQLNGTKDGMDIALLKINGNKIFYSAANRPLWLIKNDSDIIEEIKATKTAIAGYTEDDFEFTEHALNLNSGDTLYLFTDGYADQFGGEKQKKMTTKRFKSLLISIKNKSINDQKTEIENYMKNWIGDLEQVDDILVIGIRI